MSRLALGMSAFAMILALLSCMPLAPGAASGDGTELPTARVTIGESTFTVEVAETSAAQRQGLMGRTELADDGGMLFVFRDPIVPSFWMLNTLIPLDIAFIRSDGTIASTDTMTPQSLESHSPPEPVLYALEVPAGQFSDRGIEPGDAVEIQFDGT